MALFTNIVLVILTAACSTMIDSYVLTQGERGTVFVLPPAMRMLRCMLSGHLPACLSVYL